MIVAQVTAVLQVWFLAWDLPNATATGTEKKKKERKKKIKMVNFFGYVHYNNN